MGDPFAQKFNEEAKFFTNFMEGNSGYTENLKEALGNHTAAAHRVTVNLKDLETQRAGLQREIIERPAEYIPAFEQGLLNFANESDVASGEKDQKAGGVATTKPIRVAIDGHFGKNHVTPRGLNCRMVNQMVCIEGVVTSVSTGIAKLTQSIHYCEDGKGQPGDKIKSLRYRDKTALLRGDELDGAAAPKADEEGNPYVQEIGLSTYKDQQKVVIQEAPENAPTGHVPLAVECIVEQDLCDQVQPGNRVRVIGVYKAFPKVNNGMSTGVMPCRIIANNMQKMSTQVMKLRATPSDLKNFKAIAQQEDFFELLGRSFAPSISGSPDVKKGLLLLTVGGAEKNFDTGAHIRGDINVLLVGDPSCGKSQICRFVMNLSELSVSTTGRGSSGVGLTAAINVDQKTGERTLEAGAMVLGDRGTVIIDEFDKMGVSDRVAIHEVMEQQTVTIAKAGMHTTLNARCSVVAAANPIYSNWDDRLSLAQNINLPDSLLSRFDLIFVMKDEISVERDRKISDQILRQLQYRDNTGVETGRGAGVSADTGVHDSKLEKDVHKEDEAVTKKKTEVYEQNHPSMEREDQKLLTMDFLKKYIRFAKQKDDPELSKDACHLIAVYYAELRRRYDTEEYAEGQLAVTTRTLEAMIRLATAHAKLRLGTQVTAKDVEVTRALLLESRKMQVRGIAADDEEESKKRGNEEADDEDPAAKRQRVVAEEDAMDEQRSVEFRKTLAAIFSTERTFNMMHIDLKEKMEAKGFDEEEFEKGLKEMSEQQKVVVADGQVFLSL